MRQRGFTCRGCACRRPQNTRCPQESFPPLITSYILLAGWVVGDGDRCGGGRLRLRVNAAQSGFYQEGSWNCVLLAVSWTDDPLLVWEAH